MSAANVSECRESSETLSRVESSGLERGRAPVEADGVRGERDGQLGLARPDPSQDLLEVLADERLTAGEPELAHLQDIDADVDETDDLVSGHQIIAREPVHALGRHAVRAAQIALVGQREAHVGGLAAEVSTSPPVVGAPGAVRMRGIPRLMDMPRG